MMARLTRETETETAARRALRRLPNGGPAVASGLLRLGSTTPTALAAQDPGRTPTP
jgi:hypothetical protein